MSIYKPIECTPFMESVDPNQGDVYLVCYLQTSNTDIVAYSINLYDKYGSLIAEGGKTTIYELQSVYSELTEEKVNVGKNGTYLKIPFLLHSGIGTATLPSQWSKDDPIFIGTDKLGWQIVLYQQEEQYDMIVDSGVVLGSGKNRIQSSFNSNVYEAKFVQLGNIENSQFVPAGSRQAIKSVNDKFGYVYIDLEDSVIDTTLIPENATYFQLYKMGNNIEDLSESDKVALFWDEPLGWEWKESLTNPGQSYGEQTYTISVSEYQNDNGNFYPFRVYDGQKIIIPDNNDDSIQCYKVSQPFFDLNNNIKRQYAILSVKDTTNDSIKLCYYYTDNGWKRWEKINIDTDGITIINGESISNVYINENTGSGVFLLVAHGASNQYNLYSVVVNKKQYALNLLAKNIDNYTFNYGSIIFQGPTNLTIDNISFYGFELQIGTVHQPYYYAPKLLVYNEDWGNNVVDIIQKDTVADYGSLSSRYHFSIESLKENSYLTTLAFERTNQSSSLRLWREPLPTGSFQWMVINKITSRTCSEWAQTPIYFNQQWIEATVSYYVTTQGTEYYLDVYFIKDVNSSTVTSISKKIEDSSLNISATNFNLFSGNTDIICTNGKNVFCINPSATDSNDLLINIDQMPNDQPEEYLDNYQWSNFIYYNNRWYGLANTFGENENNLIVFYFEKVNNSWKIKVLKQINDIYIQNALLKQNLLYNFNDCFSLVSCLSDTNIKKFFVDYLTNPLENTDKDLSIPQDTRIILNQQQDSSGRFTQNGIYYPRYSTVPNYSDNSIVSYTIIVEWYRTPDADTIGELMNKCVLVGYNSPYYPGENVQTNIYTKGMTAQELSQLALNVTEFSFIQEKPVQVVDGTEDVIANEIYYNVPLSDALPLNEKAKLYIRQSDVIQSGMLWQQLQNQGNVSFIIEDYNKEKAFARYNELYTGSTGADESLKVDETRYLVKSSYKASDINPFFIYSVPNVNIVLNSTTITERYFDADFEYSQDQNIQWQSYQWQLLTGDGKEIIHVGDITYEGNTGCHIEGLENDGSYILRLVLTTNIGNVFNYDTEITCSLNAASPSEEDKPCEILFEDNCACKDANRYNLFTRFVFDLTKQIKNLHIYKREIWLSEDGFTTEYGPLRTVFTPRSVVNSMFVIDENAEEENWKILLNENADYENIELVIDAQYSVVSGSIINNEAILKDYNVSNLRNYEYIVCYKDENDNNYEYHHVVVTNWIGCILTELHCVYKNRNYFYVANKGSWRFKFNIEPDTVTQNIANTQQQTLSKYQKFSYGNKNSLSGSVNCLLGKDFLPADYGGYIEKLDYNVFDDYFTSNDRTNILNEWRKVCYSGNPKLLRTEDGQNYIIQITEASTKTNNQFSNRPVSVSFSWTEIYNVTDYAIINEPITTDTWEE